MLFSSPIATGSFLQNCKFSLLATLLANLMGVRVTSMSSKSVEELKRFHPPTGLEPVTFTLEALTERYARHQGGLFDPRQEFYQAQYPVIRSESLSMIVLAQIYCPGGIMERQPSPTSK